jgi:hypothetical protein
MVRVDSSLGSDGENKARDVTRQARIQLEKVRIEFFPYMTVKQTKHQI